MTAAGTAATASGQPRGLITAHASTASSAISEIVSPAAAFSKVLPQFLAWIAPAASSTRPSSRGCGRLRDPSGLTMDPLAGTLVA